MRQALPISYARPRYFLPHFVVLEVISVALILASPSPLVGFFAFITFLSLPLLIISPGSTLLLLVLYISIFPSKTLGKRYEFFQYYVKEEMEVLGVVIVFIVLVFLHLSTHVQTFEWSHLDFIVLAFLSYSLFSGMLGMYNSQNVFRDLFYASLYCIYFPARYVCSSRIWVRRLVVAVVAISTIVALQYVLFQLQHLDLRSMVISRVFTQQPHLGLVTISILTAVILYSRVTKYRLLATVLLIPNFVMVVLSQQRGLWIGVFVTLIVLLFLYNMRTGPSLARMTKFVVALIIVLASMIGILFLAQTVLNLEFLSTVLWRIGSFEMLNVDLSLNLRFIQISRVLGEWQDRVFFGSGLGATFSRFVGARITDGIDNSYFFVLWKMGFLGLVSFVAIYFTFLKHGWKSYWRIKSSKDKVIVSSLYSAMIGLMVVSLTNMSLIRYRFIIIWAIIIAIVHNYYLETVKAKSA